MLPKVASLTTAHGGTLPRYDLIESVSLTDLRVDGMFTR
jgi:hypothetical protein